jgi:hypothetical protein
MRYCGAQVETETSDSKNGPIDALTKDKQASRKNRSHVSKGSNSHLISRSYLIPPNECISNTVVEVEAAHPKCSGKHCPNSGKHLLNINYINMSGYFCDSCKEYLLKEGLATTTGDIVI